jgi:aminocarboxymuconate-semialdehyde decarboxylase
MIIDMHAHIAPEHFPIKTGTPSAGLWPSMEHLASGDVDMYIGDKMFRKFADTVWDSVTRSDALPGIGVDKQVLSPLPQLLMYHIDPVEGA